MKEYRVLAQQTFCSGKYSLVPIRAEDRYDIMKWRNEQMYHLRQNKLLTKEEQDNYFKNVVANLFHQQQPDQILFSFLENGKCIGYGGLVHINWIDKNAEISFLINTKLEKKFFKQHWITFLKLIQSVAKEIALHKIFTFGYDIAAYRFEPIIESEFQLNAILKDHVYIDNEYKDVKIYEKILQ